MSEQPRYTPSPELRDITERIRFLESAVRHGYSGNEDWRAKQSCMNQLSTLRKKFKAVEERSLKEYEIAVLDWKLKKMEEEDAERKAAEMKKIWEENPILGMEV